MFDFEEGRQHGRKFSPRKDGTEFLSPEDGQNVTKY